MKHAAGARASSWVKGLAILGVAAVVSKLIGTLQKIPLQNIAGDEAYGIYTIVYPLYITILVAATAGFPIAVSKFVADQVSLGNTYEARRILRISAVLLTLTGFASFAALYFGADALSLWTSGEQTVPAIRSVSFALLFVPVMAALRGYFQGFGNMVPTAVSQVVEQTVRVATMIVLLLFMVAHQYPQSWIAAGATFGSTAGAVAGLAVMLYYWRRGNRALPRVADKTMDTSRHSTAWWVRRFILFAIPVCLGSIVMPILTMVDSFTLPKLFLSLGWTEQQAAAQFGIYSRAAPLVQTVSMIASSMSVALVPAIASAKQSGQAGLITNQTSLAIRYTWLIGIASSVGLAVCAAPINRMLFTNDEGTVTMAIMAFTAVFSTVNVVSGSLLQGLGSVVGPARNLLIAAVVKITGNIMLVPHWGLNGAAIAAVIAFAVAAALNMRQLARQTGVRFGWKRDALVPLAALLLMCSGIYAIGYFAQALFSAAPASRLASTVTALSCVLFGALIYIATLIRLRVITVEELKLSPKLQAAVFPVLRKLRLVRN